MSKDSNEFNKDVRTERKINLKFLIYNILNLQIYLHDPMKKI